MALPHAQTAARRSCRHAYTASKRTSAAMVPATASRAAGLAVHRADGGVAGTLSSISPVRPRRSCCRLGRPPPEISAHHALLPRRRRPRRRQAHDEGAPCALGSSVRSPPCASTAVWRLASPSPCRAPGREEGIEDRRFARPALMPGRCPRPRCEAGARRLSTPTRAERHGRPWPVCVLRSRFRRTPVTSARSSHQCSSRAGISTRMPARSDGLDDRERLDHAADARERALSPASVRIPECCPRGDSDPRMPRARSARR